MTATLARRSGLLLAFVLLVGASSLIVRAFPVQPVGTWQTWLAVAEPRTGAASATLADGRTLIAGGILPDGSVSGSVVIYDPDANASEAAGELLAPRTGHTATLLADGRVAVIGGVVDGEVSGDIEIFDPGTGTSVLAAALGVPRTGHAAARLADGSVLIVGGVDADGAPHADAELYDAANGGGISAVAFPMSVARIGASATTLIDGRVLVAGGHDGAVDLNSAEVYEPTLQQFAFVDTQLSVARSGHTALLLPFNNGVLIAGGTSNGEPQTATDLFLPAVFPDPYTYGMGTFAAGGALQQARSGGVSGSTAIEGYAFTAGGGPADSETYRFATIKTDKDDYAPGQLAIISGSGWQPNAEVTLLFQEDPAVHEDYTFTVTADDEGNFTTDQWTPDAHDLGVRFYLTATDSQSRAQTTFTDARQVTAVITPTTATVGTPVTYTVTVRNTSSAGETIDSLEIAIPSGSGTPTAFAVTATDPGPANRTWDVPVILGGFIQTKRSGAGVNSIDPNGTIAVTFTTTATTAGTKTWTVTPWTNMNFNGSSFPIQAGFLQPSVTVTAVKVTPTISFGAAPTPTFGGGSFSVSATTTNTDSSALTYSVVSGPCSLVSGSTFNSSGAGVCVVQASGAETANFNAASNTQSVTIAKATPTATLTVSNSPQAYTGAGLAATVGIFASSVPGAVANILTGGAATQTLAGTFAVTANFIPTDTANYNSLLAQPAGNFVIGKATPTATLVVSNSPQTYDGSPKAATVNLTTSSVPGAVSNILTGGAATQTNAGTFAVTANFVPTDTANYNSLLAQPAGNFVIGKATPTATLTVSNSPQTYDGSPKAATVGISGNSVPGTAANVLTGGLATQTTAGTYAVTADFVPNDTVNYNSLLAQSAGDFVISKATPTATLAVSNSPQTYTGGGLAATVNITTSSVPGAVANILTGGAPTQIPAGTYAVTADFVPTDTANYNSLLAQPAGNFVINKATPTATLAVNNSPQTYDGSPKAATVGISGNSVPGAVANILTGGAATQTTAGTYAVTADFVPTDTANYNSLLAQPAGNFVINKATPTATLVVDNSPQTYDGSPKAATVSISVSSVTGAVTNILTGGAATQTNASTYPVTADFVPADTTNYNSLLAQPAGNFVINKATPTATLVVSNSPQTYDGSPKAATVDISVSSVSGTVASILTGGAATQTNASTYPVTADFVPNDTANYNSLLAQPAGNFVLNKATPTATLAVSNSPQTYDGSPKAATVSISASSVTGAVANILTGGAATQTNASTYSVTADFVPSDPANYNSLPAQPAGNFVINKATPTATLAVSNSPQTYDGSPKAATVSISASSVPGAVTNILTGGAPTQINANTYAVTADFVPNDTANYNSLLAQSAGNFVINKATPTATLTVSNSPQTYDGSPKAATVGISASSVSGTVANILTGGAATQTNASTYPVTADFVPNDTANYNSLLAQPAGNFVILKATPTATLVVSNSPQTYNGSPKAAMVAISVSSVSGTVASILTGGAATQTNAGTYAVTADFVPNDTANYNSLPAQAAGNFVINKATPTATLVVDNSPQTFDGSPKAAMVSISVSSVSGTVANILTGGAPTQINASTYPVTADFVPTDSANYHSLLAQPAGNFVINKATPTATLAVSNSPQTYDGSPKAAAVSIAASSVPGAVANILTGGAPSQINASTYAVTADFVPTDTGNYNSLLAQPAGNFVINKATPTATLAVSNSPQTYTAAPLAATVAISLSSVPGAVANILTGGAPTQTPAGTYAATADFVPTDTANYNSLPGLPAGNFVIIKATPTATLAVSNSPRTYASAGLAATVGISASSVPGAVANIITGAAATQTNAGTYPVTADFVPTDTANYNSLLAQPAGNFVINKAALTITAVTNTKTYDGTTSALGVPTVYGLKGTDSVTGRAETYDNRNAGMGKTLSVSAYTVNDGNGGNNYVVTPVNNTTGVINKAALTIAALTNSKVYDTTISAAAIPTVTGKQTGDTVTGLAETYNNPMVGTGKTLSVSAYTVNDGNSGNNYTVSLVANTTGVVIAAGTVTTNVTVLPGTQQYSDKVDLQATVGSSPPIGGTVVFYINKGTPQQQTLGSIAAAANSTVTISGVALVETVTGSMNPATHSVTAVFTPSDLVNFTGSYGAANLAIAPEDARATYTGLIYVTTASPTSSIASVILSATIQDITATPEAGVDTAFGDIRNAKVTFYNRDTSAVIAANVPVGLVTAGDTKTGTATYPWSVNIGNADSATYTVGVIVTGYYARDSASDNTLVTVKKPTPGSIGGGGYLVNAASAGTYAGSVGAKTNFGLNVKFNKNNTNLQGNTNIIIRRTETDGVHVYQIKSNATESLNITSPSAGVYKASFTSKANVTDITNPAAPIALGGNKQLQITLTDNGEPGALDTIGVMLTDTSGGLLFSGKWSGTNSVEQLLGGGNLQVRPN